MHEIIIFENKNTVHFYADTLFTLLSLNHNMIFSLINPPWMIKFFCAKTD